ncbi:uroporphyrin-III C-methyltransferase [Aliidongia dinghuensis]|uniref:uroporphyrinogen-III C-methyltransferase n=1 Tax=Aliidongia dinghuensis TaxID=1867774 RepID=A0A8J2YPH6_9PROT|nr:uroporphyrinogen-III C-methyltransferase [Aliidongia dinghuensis]GGF02690.1 uroporphyrin-III C-methyltransferase [Aliidongia dinghuensis]
MDRVPFTFPEFAPGSVWLVGAGPGDPGLLTLIGRHALETADAIVYDALIDERLLDFTRADAVLEYAGKRGGRPSPTQPDISKRLIELARAGHRVVRLKGGDPFVFGRGGEEALTLAAAGVPFRIVPGITAGIGGLAYAGIPVTHRDTNQVLALVTGHDAQGLLPEGIDWASLARAAPVLVFYMAFRQLDAIAARLVAEGRSPDEPVAVVSKAARADQQVLTATLATVAAAVAASAIEPPAIVVVGPVVQYRDQLDWLGHWDHP